MQINNKFACILALVCALSMQPTRLVALDIGQYSHTTWKMRDGFVKGTIWSLAQTSDGYLWLGTDSGLTRFDGVRAIPWQPPTGTALPNNRIRVLLASRDGALWIGTLGGLAKWDGRNLVSYPPFGSINGLIQDREGSIWATTGNRPPYTGLVCAIHGAKTECSGKDGSLGAFVGALHQARDGSLWFIASEGVWRWNPGAPKLYPMPDRGGDPHALGETASGTVVVATASGIKQIIHDQPTIFSLPSLPPSLKPVCLLSDHDHGLWIGTVDQGLFHIFNGRVDQYRRSDGLSSDRVNALLEDREGNVWAATPDGLDRFRVLPATTYSAEEGLPLAAKSVLADRNGSIWLSTLGGLYRWRDGRMYAYRARKAVPARNASAMQAWGPMAEEVIVAGLPEAAQASLFQDRRGRIWFGSQKGTGYLENDRFIPVHGIPNGFVDSITEDRDGNIWIAHRDVGLMRISSDLTGQKVPLPLVEWAGNIARAAFDPVKGGLWLGFFRGGVAYFAAGRVRATYTAADGLGNGAVNDIRVTDDGTVWAATDGGLSRIKAGRIATLTGKNGLPCDAIHSSIVDDKGATWVYTACGLARITRSDLGVWSAAAGRGDASPIVPMFVLNDSDGVRSFSPFGSNAAPKIANARDGTLWLIAPDGVTTVDPLRLPVNLLPPPVRIEQLIADRKTYAVYSPIRLPPLARDVQLDYTGLSLAAPEKVQFRYKLEGRDFNWQDAGARRQAFYTDLAPGDYRFRVIADNNSGIWNTKGATLAFSVAPAYWQTNWFRALCAALLVLMLGAIYQFRMRHLARAATQVRKAEERHRELLAELAHANRIATLGQLTASIAHEVSQPLSATIANANAALRWLKAEPPNSVEVQMALDRIVESGHRAADIVNHIRTLVKKKSGPEGEIDFNEEIAGIIALTKSEADKHRVELRTELSPDLPVTRGDRVQLQQVLLNLVINAIEAISPLAYGPREIVICSEPNEAGGIAVSVGDTGPGIDLATSERLFEPFHTTKQGGLGMGLSISRSIIESHGGQLWVTANTPRGAIFHFTLPAIRARLP